MRDAVSPPSFGNLPTYLEGREGVVSRIADIAARMGVTQGYAQKPSSPVGCRGDRAGPMWICAVRGPVSRFVSPARLTSRAF